MLSFRNMTWRRAPFDEAEARAMAEERKLPAVTARVMASRGVTARGAGAYLSPMMRDSMPDPFSMIDMRKACEMIADAIGDRARVGVWTDYDVDGACSAAIMIRFLRGAGLTDVTLRVPDRVAEGYGPNGPGLVAFGADRDLVISLDAGTSAVDALAQAREAGVRVLVIDHHAAGRELPVCEALVNPNRPDDDSGLGHMCAAGLTLLACAGTARVMSERGKVTAPDLMTFCGIAALATVCDVVPLRDVNRAIVSTGLRAMSRAPIPGVRALLEAAGAGPGIDAKTCGFVLGPRINAGGRIADSRLGSLLLLTDDADEAKRLAAELHEINDRRKAMDGAARESAMGAFPGRAPGERRLAFAEVDAHEGIVGIVAARVKDALLSPAIVVAPAHGGLLKGSARSVDGFDIGAALIDATAAGLLVKGGGHAMAGGLTISPDKRAAFEAFMNERIAASDYGRDGVSSLVDAEVRIAEATADMVASFGAMEPLGRGNERPAIMVPGVIEKVDILKGKHVRVTLLDGGRRMSGLIWNAAGTPLAEGLLGAQGRRAELLGNLEVNEYNGQTRVQMMIEDARLSG